VDSVRWSQIWYTEPVSCSNDNATTECYYWRAVLTVFPITPDQIRAIVVKRSWTCSVYDVLMKDCGMLCACSVGANHDGTGNECSGDNQYVMASSPRALTPRNFNNPFHFSHCSVRSFRQYLYRLNKYVPPHTVNARCGPVAIGPTIWVLLQRWSTCQSVPTWQCAPSLL